MVFKKIVVVVDFENTDTRSVIIDIVFLNIGVFGQDIKDLFIGRRYGFIGINQPKDSHTKQTSCHCSDKEPFHKRFHRQITYQ